MKRESTQIDSLTGLPTRSTLLLQLNSLLSDSNLLYDSDEQHAILQIGINHFRKINNSLGHDHGDRVLITLTNRIRSCVKSGIVARLEGDEFGLLLAVQDETHAIKIAQRVYLSLIKPLRLNEVDIQLGIRIGIVLCRGEKDSEVILRNADIALQHAQRFSEHFMVMFRPAMLKTLIKRAELEQQLRRGIVNNELQAHYQPIYSVQEKKITGFEVLVRWNHPTRGLLQPIEFLELAEQLDLIKDIDYWILNSATRQLRTWLTESAAVSNDLTLNLNLSAAHFSQTTILHHINNALKNAQLPAKNIKLELTETMIMAHTSLVDEVFTALSQRGINICLDDFGVGYSSLSRLVRLPIHTLKIDRKFIAEMGLSKSNINIVRLIINLAHDLSMEVVAEGVSTAEELALLVEMNCDFVQGYYIAKPCCASDAIQLLHAEPPLPMPTLSGNRQV